MSATKQRQQCVPANEIVFRRLLDMQMYEHPGMMSNVPTRTGLTTEINFSEVVQSFVRKICAATSEAQQLHYTVSVFCHFQ